MTDRVRTLIVTLERDTRDDDAEHFVNVIRAIRGVATVDLGPVVDGFADNTARRVVGNKVGGVLWALGNSLHGMTDGDAKLREAVEDFLKREG